MAFTPKTPANPGTPETVNPETLPPGPGTPGTTVNVPIVSSTTIPANQ